MSSVLERLNLESKEAETIAIKAIALCFKPYLKPEEAMVYTNLAHTRFTKRCLDYGIFKTSTGYFKKEDLDLMLSGGPTKYETALQDQEMIS
jgi:hypothetical protein